MCEEEGRYSLLLKRNKYLYILHKGGVHTIMFNKGIFIEETELLLYFT